MFLTDIIIPTVDNCLQTLKDRIAQCKAEKSLQLDLTHLMLTAIPDEVFEFDWLESLDISGIDRHDENGFGLDPRLTNILENLPDQIGKLKNLKKLEIGHNKISGVSCLADLSNLVEFYADNNQIADIEVLSRLPKLGKVSVDYNKIRRIPELEKCHWLSITGNNLEGDIDCSGLTIIKKLYASSNRISNILGIGYCSQLTELHLNNNQLNEIPDFTELTKLKYLNLNRNQIKNLDGGCLPFNLEVLDVIDNSIHAIEKLPDSLTKVNLKNNKLTQPPSFGLASRIKWLHLGNNVISTVSGSEFHEGLEHISLQNNIIESLGDAEFPSSIKYIDLSKNKLTSIPEIKDLSNIEKIILSENKIVSIEGAWNFAHLSTLVIENNQLQSLEFLGNLPELSELWLNKNEIPDITLLIKYQNLRLIIITNNKIEALPPALSNLPKLKILEVSGNKKLWKSIPIEIWNLDNIQNDFGDYDEITEYFWDMDYPDDYGLPERAIHNSTDALIPWLQAIAQSSEINQSIRLIFCGNGRVGKSSILDCLQNRRFNINKESTHAIAIERLELPNLECWVWDFGGQEIYHSTHELFMGGSAVYVLVWDEETEKTGEVRDPISNDLVLPNFKLRYWIDFIRSNSPSSPIIVVQNKTDNDRSFPSEEILPSNLNIRYITGFNAENQNVGKEQLKFFIQQAAWSIREYNMTVPASWWQVRDHILTLKMSHEKTTMTFPEFEHLCREKQVIVEHILVLRKYLDMVSVIHVLEKPLGEIVIINDMWVIQPIYKALERGTSFFEALQSTGRFSEKRFIEVVNSTKEYTPEQIRLFLRLIQSVGLCFQINKSTKNNLEYIIPRFLANELPNNVERYFKGLEDETLFLKYAGSLHYQLIHKFIVETGRKTDLDKIGRRGIFFMGEGGLIAFIHADFEKDTISIQVAGGRQINDRKWFINAIRNTFREVTTGYKYKNYIQGYASYDGKSYASIKSIRKQYELHKDKKDLIPHLKVESVDAKIGLNLQQLIWAIETDEKANFKELPDVVQEKIESTPEKPKVHTREKPQSLPKEAQRKILFLFSSPDGKNPLNFGREFGKIQEAHRSSKYRDRFQEPIIEPCMVKDNLTKYILTEKPDMIHFSMHSSKSEGLYFEDKNGNIQSIAPEQLAKFFKVISMEYRPNLVVLSACNTEKHARAILPYCHYVIGTRDFFPDKASVIYAETLYGHLFNSVEIETAHAAALLALDESDVDLSFKDQKVPIHQIPILFTDKK